MWDGFPQLSAFLAWRIVGGKQVGCPRVLGREEPVCQVLRTELA